MICLRSHHFLAVALILAAFIGPNRLTAQSTVPLDPGRVQLSRTELQLLLTAAEEAERSTAYSLVFRNQAGTRANMIRHRLESGDFQVGDQIVLTVAGEADLTGTFTVQTGPSILLPAIGEVPLDGVLRSELRDRLQEHLARYLRNPDVQATSLFRIMVSGAVGNAGYFVVGAQSLVSDAIMGAGGFAPGADLNRVEIRRGGSVIWSARELQEAIAAGGTFDELSLAAGDHLIVPDRAATGTMSSLRSWIMAVPALVVSFTALRQIF